MAEIFLSPIIQALFEKLISSDLIKFAREEKVHTSINKWKDMVQTIKAVLNDAEDKQITNQAVKDWLGELQFLAHDAEDVLDLFATEILRRKLIAEPETQASTSKFKLKSIIPTCCTSFKPSAVRFNVNMGSKIDEITREFQQLLKQISLLKLSQIVGGASSRTRETQATPTTSVPESYVIGREDEKEAILELVLSSKSNDDHGVSVIPIVGLGGVGKTTIARLVYNDDRLEGYFDLKAWVCVSDEEKFDIIRVTKAILESFTKQAPDVTTLNSLQERLVEKLSKKKFLLVLDDVWLENYEEWTALHRPLEAGAPGSKIIVTTRNESVSSLTGTISSAYHLKQLSDDDCQSLFIHHASVDFDKHPSLRHIGEEIVKRCNGLPLAAKALGGLLRGKVNPDKWKTVLDSPLWEFPEGNCQVLPVLRLSYHHLPPHLKQCFAFCAIFPKDYEFEEEKLVLLWMALGLVVKQGSKERHLEDVGGGYFQDLLSRSFFQRSSSNESMFVMHDLVNDLAQWVAGETIFRLEEKQSESSTKALHSSYIVGDYDGVKTIEAFNGLKRLRTFLAPRIRYKSGSNFSNDVPLKLLPQFKCLRALSLSYYMITELPDSIGDLKHLRYFDVSHTIIIALPESTSTLYNLQTLILKGCYCLKKLPTEMRNLINLHHLDITGANSLQEMPLGIGKLRNLQILSNFIVGNNGGHEIKELMGLNNLRRTLCISRLENVVDARDAREARLEDKQDLDELTLQWSSESRNEGAEKEVLDMLRPHNKLKGLTIECYSGIRFSTWVEDPSFSNMVFLKLVDCGKCRSLPAVGQLPLLKNLFIKGMKKVNNVGIEFYGGGIGKPFSSLEALRFMDMEEWEQWCPCEQVEVFPQLRELSVIRCPKLLGNIPDHLPSLEKLEIRKCDSLKSVVRGGQLPSMLKRLDIDYCKNLQWLVEEDSTMQKSNTTSLLLEVLSIEECPALTSLSSRGGELPATLKHLTIWYCSMLESIAEEFCNDSSLARIYICHCESLKSLPKGLHNLSHLREFGILGCPNLVLFADGLVLSSTNLREVCIFNCEKVEALPNGMHNLNCLRELRIGNCPGIISFPEEGFPTNLTRLEIYNLKINKLVLEWGLNRLTSLKELRIVGGIPDLASFPPEEDGMMLPASLTFLQIGNFPSLEHLSWKGFQNLNSLEYLWINNCPKLKSFPKEGLPPSLLQLEINDCPRLEEACEKNKGPDWPKIAHIPHVEINREVRI